MSISRLREIIQLAHELGWVYPPDKTPYPLMQLSEVEKCMTAMYNDSQLHRMIEWAEEKRSEQKQSSDETTDKVCKQCNGSGWVRGGPKMPGHYTCGICKGTGKVQSSDETQDLDQTARKER